MSHHMTQSSDYMSHHMTQQFYSLREMRASTLALVTQLCPNLCDFMNYSLPGSSVHGIHQARIQQWVAISFFRGFSRPRDQIQVPHIAGRFFIF